MLGTSTSPTKVFKNDASRSWVPTDNRVQELSRPLSSACIPLAEGPAY